MLKEIKKGRRWRRNGEKNYPGWKETIEFILQNLPESRYAKNSVKNPLIVHPSTSGPGIMMMMTAAEAKPPHPNGKPQILSLIHI